MAHLDSKLSLPLQPVLDEVERGFDPAVERLIDFLRIPSISTDPAYDPEVRRAGQWAVDRLREIGFTAELRDTTGHPMVVAHHPGPGGDVPHILYYGHYDVQPADPLELWHSPPFEPVVVEAEHGPRIVARGAVDDKGQVMTFLEAFRAWHAVHGTLPVRVTVLLEGEEESGSPSLVPFLKVNREELSADVCIVTDTNSWDIDTPAITTALRGLLSVELTLHGPNRDLHSGMFGGLALNPINALTRILGQIHDDKGRVQFPGFYDDVQPLSEAERATLAALGFDAQAFLRDVGLEAEFGEQGYAPIERLWFRPTCDINGIYGGYTGVGGKTVIASTASAKITCRLVASQDPDKILAGFKAFLDARTPPGARWELKLFGSAPGIRIPTDSPYLQAAMNGLQDVYSRPPVQIGSGGSIPVVGYLRENLGLDSLLVGFGLDDDRIHSPNEKFELKCLRNGIRSHAIILAKLAEMGRQ